MANEIDAAQERGEVARNGVNQFNKEGVQTSDTLGLDRRRVAEWRETRDAGEDVVEAAISGALAEGRAPTKADIRNRVRGVSLPKLMKTLFGANLRRRNGRS